MNGLKEPTSSPARPRFNNAVEWHDSLGNVPLDRIIFDPLPGTATEKDLLLYVDRDKRLCELIDGTLVPKPVNFWNGVVSAAISCYLSSFVYEHDLGVVIGPTGTVRMKSGHVRLFNCAFVSSDRVPEKWESIPSLSPDLTIDILFPSHTELEISNKLRDCFESGTRLSWLVDPEARTAIVYDNPVKASRIVKENDLLDGEQVVPGFKLPLSKIFEDLRPH